MYSTYIVKECRLIINQLVTGALVVIWMISLVIDSDNHLDMTHMIFAVFDVGPLHLAINGLYFTLIFAVFVEVS